MFTITSLTNVGRDGHAVGGYTSPEFIRFMESFITSQNKEFRFPSVVTVMRSVQSRLRSKDRTDRFACYTRVGQTHFDCPGNACHLSIEWSRIIGYTSGGEISCHNLDGATQQLMLLCGLAELASLYDEWIAGKK
ncbi:MAG: hypothetical protein K9M11_01365 [Candidatus Pacebacteria bacterium]|nr:hypothetical protein [Candidatus Paceibacterota bacterium]